MKDTFKPPLFSELASPHFAEFSGAAEDYFNKVSSEDILKSITLEDLMNAREHPSRFLVMQHPASPKDRTQGQFRIHGWPAGIDRSETDPHRHPWHLTVKTVFGEKVEQMVDFEPVDDPGEANYQAWESQHNPTNVDEIRLAQIGLVRATFSDVLAYSQDDVSSLPQTQAHVTPVSGEGMLITVALMSPTISTARNLKPKNMPFNSIEPPRTRLTDIKDVWQQVQEAREQLAA